MRIRNTGKCLTKQAGRLTQSRRRAENLHLQEGLSDMNRNEKLKSLLEKAGVRVESVCCIGAFVHIDTHKKYEYKIRNIMTQIGANNIKTMSAAADGKHLDGSKNHRIVAIF